MIAIDYPKQGLDKFHTAYCDALGVETHNAKLEELLVDNAFDDFKQLFKAETGEPNISINALLTLPFKALCRVSLCFNECREKLSKADQTKRVDELNKIINYSTKQRNIAAFFRQQSEVLRLSSCYYCNIDFVYAFKDIPDFVDDMTFVRESSIDELMRLKGIKEEVAQQIIDGRDAAESLDDLGLETAQIKVIQNREVKKSHDHFTLDHVLAKSDHPLVALSLYNFVPSCYACNCKFKSKIPLVTHEDESYLSPTSEDFSLEEDVRFETMPYEMVDHMQESDLEVRVVFSNNQAQQERYFAMFKLKGRYAAHKSEALALIKKNQRYKQSRIEELAKQVGASPEEVKRDLFGKELFDDKLKTKSLSKYKKDIARALGIIRG